MTGSEHNDEFYTDEYGNIRTRTNRSGGVQVFVYPSCFLLIDAFIVHDFFTYISMLTCREEYPMVKS